MRPCSAHGERAPRLLTRHCAKKGLLFIRRGQVGQCRVPFWAWREAPRFVSALNSASTALTSSDAESSVEPAGSVLVVVEPSGTIATVLELPPVDVTVSTLEAAVPQPQPPITLPPSVPIPEHVSAANESAGGPAGSLAQEHVAADTALAEELVARTAPLPLVDTPEVQEREVSPSSSLDDTSNIRTAAVPEAAPAPVQAGAAKEPAAAPVVGIRLRAALTCVAIGLAVRFVAPIPGGVTLQAWTLLAVFCSTIAGLILEPMPVSAWSLCCVTTLLATKAVTFQTAMSGLTNEAIWLIVFAFFFAKAFEKTGLGNRVANCFVAAAGGSSLGVAYSLAFAEALVAPAMPSCTARAGGIFMPVIKFLAINQGSEPRHGRKRMGAFLVNSQMQVSANIAALFTTGAAQNLLAINIARSMGVVIADTWTTWAVGAALPGVVSVFMIPALMYKLDPPEVTATPEAPAQARERLRALGPLSRGEAITLCTLAAAVVVWVMGEHLGVSAVLGAMLALSSLLLTGVLEWKDCLEYSPAWDTLMWFAVLMSMCSALSASGLVGRMAEAVGHCLAAAQLPWQACFGLLHAVFFWSHYIFASQVGHVGALYGAFLAMMMAAGVPATLAALTLGYSSNLFGSITHYASGPAAVYYASGYLRLSEVMSTGFFLALRSWAVWGVVGMAWWKFLGWY